MRRPHDEHLGEQRRLESGYLDVLTHGEVSEGVAVLERARETCAPPAVRPPARDVSGTSSSTEPELGRSKPVMTFTSVVLPAPFGPMSPTTSPGGEVERDALERMNAHE